MTEKHIIATFYEILLNFPKYIPQFNILFQDALSLTQIMLTMICFHRVEFKHGKNAVSINIAIFSDDGTYKKTVHIFILHFSVDIPTYFLFLLR